MFLTATTATDLHREHSVNCSCNRVPNIWLIINVYKKNWNGALHKHFYIHMFFSALPVCCSSVVSVFLHTGVCREPAWDSFVKWHSLVFIAIHLRDSTWLPGACGRFMWLKLYIASSEHACDPLRGALNDSQAELPWQMAYERLRATKRQHWLCLPLLLPDLAGWQSGGAGGGYHLPGYSVVPNVCVYVCDCVFVVAGEGGLATSELLQLLGKS